jgi:uncharacterized membrane protein
MARPETPHPREQSLERINAFSDGIFAIIITIMVLDLKKPESATFQALGHLWPVWVSYIASYIFVAIVWVNHHFLLKNATRATPLLIWANFGHMFVVSLIPFLTAWMAGTRLAAVPVAMYAYRCHAQILPGYLPLPLIDARPGEKRGSGSRRPGDAGDQAGLQQIAI